MTQGVAFPRIPSREVGFEVFAEDFGCSLCVTATYVSRGPVFRSSARRSLRGIQRSEEHRLQFDLLREASADLYAQVEAHRAVTEPIPND